MSLSNEVLDYESGLLNTRQVVELFGRLISTKGLDALNRTYRRDAEALIIDNWVDKNGNVNYKKLDKELPNEN